MIIGTCGHEINLDWNESDKGIVKIKDRDREGNKIIDYVVLCETCLIWHHKNGLILHNEAEEIKWLKL
jgi:hypothetical protein